MNILVDKIGVYGLMGLGFVVGMVTPTIVQKICQVAVAIFKGIKKLYNESSFSIRIGVQPCNHCLMVPPPLDTGSLPPKYDDKKL